MEDIKKRVIDCMQKVEIYLPEDTEDYGNINLNDYIPDSVAFISFIVAVEEEFGIELPDELLMQSALSTVDSFCTQLENVIK